MDRHLKDGDDHAVLLRRAQPPFYGESGARHR
jgi:hypothetical protein